MDNCNAVDEFQVVGLKQLSFLPSAGESEQPGWRVPVALVPSQELTGDSTLATALHWYQQELIRCNYAQNTVKTYAKAVALFLRFVGAGRSLRSITPHDLKSFQAWVEGEVRSAKTAEVKLTAVRTLFRLLYEREVLPSNTARDMCPAKAHTAAPVVLTRAQAEAVRRVAAERAAAGDPLPAIAITLMLDMGLRVGEVANLHVDDVDVSDPLRPVVHVRYKDPRHTAKVRQLIAPPALVPLVRQQKACLAENEERLAGVSRRWLQQLTEDIGREAGLRRTLTTQTLRWTYISEQYSAGVEAETLRRRLGLSLFGWEDVCKKLAKLHPV